MKKKCVLSGLLPYLMVFPSAILMLVVVFYPIISSIRKSFFQDNGEIGLENYLYFFADQMQRTNMIYTLRIVIVTVFLDIVISYILAVYLRYFGEQSQQVDRHIVSAAQIYSGVGSCEWYDYHNSGFRPDQSYFQTVRS